MKGKKSPRRRSIERNVVLKPYKSDHLIVLKEDCLRRTSSGPIVLFVCAIDNHADHRVSDLFTIQEGKDARSTWMYLCDKGLV